MAAVEGRRVEVSSYDQYVWAVRHHIIPLLGAVRLRELTPELVDAWLRELIRTDGAGKRRLGPTSARLVRKVLSPPIEAVAFALRRTDYLSATNGARRAR